MAVNKTFKPMNIPEFKTTKSGYEVRTEILGMAKELVMSDFQFKWQGWEVTTQRDSNGTIVSKVDMPSFPGIEKVLDTAQKMYDFVNLDVTKK